MSYESGFSQGEYDAFHDRRARVRREMTEDPRTAEEIGYWDAYRPRGGTWDAMQSTPTSAPTFQAFA